jgi:hypothetical protein
LPAISKSQQRATSKLWNDASTTLDAVVDAEINGSSWLEDMSDAATFRQTTTDPLTPYLGRDELSDDARSTTPAFDTQLDMFDDESFSVRSDNSDDDTDEDYVQASSIACGYNSASMSSSVEPADDESDHGIILPSQDRSSATYTSDTRADLRDNNLLLHSVAEFCTFPCKEPFRNGRSSSTVMVYFAGITGISKDGTTFERPSN